MTSELFKFSPGNTPLLISFPHVGTFIPAALSKQMTADALTVPDTDWHVDRLYDCAPALGAGTLIATHSRYVIDLNRDPNGIQLYPGRHNSELLPLTRFDGTPVYQSGQAPGTLEISDRLDHYWRPYHTALSAELDRLKDRFGFAILWDAHSIRSEVPRLFEGRLPDLNLGSAKGASVDPALLRCVSAALKADTRFSSVVDGRFSGGYITRHYGRPDRRIHALQLEIAQAAYMDEAPPFTYRSDRAEALKTIIERTIRSVFAWACDHAASVRLEEKSTVS